MKRRPSIPFVLLTGALLWTALAIAAAALWPIYRSPALITLIVVALVTGTAVSAVATWRRWSFAATFLATVGAFLLVGVPAAVPSEASFGVVPSFRGLVDLVFGVALGWKQLLTISLPVGTYQALLVPALVSILVATVISLSVAMRTSVPELSVLPPIALFVVAVAFGPTYPDQSIFLPIALIVVIGLTLVWLRWRRRRDAVSALEAAMDAGGVARRRREFGFAGVRTVVSSVVILALASGAALAAANAVPPTGDRSVLRTALAQPFDPRDYVSPLSGYRRYWQPSTANAVLFEVGGAPLGTHVRLATLDSYDGVVYAVGSGADSSESGSFARVPARFDQEGVVGERVTIDLTVAGYEGVWVPTVGLFEEISFDGERAADLRDSFYYNKVSATAAVVDGLEPGDSYTLHGVLPLQPSKAELSSLTPGAVETPPIRVSPDELTENLDRYVTGLSEPGERLVAMLDGLAAEGYISHGVGPDEPASRSGHSGDRLAELFTARRMIGDGEQYAVAAAVMADSLGFPARVVLGFVTSDPQIRGSDVSAWIEVNTAEYGWVTIDATPPVREIPEEDPLDNSQVARPPTVVKPPEIESDTTNRQSNPDSEQALQPDLDPALQAFLAVLRIVGWNLLALLVVASPFLLIVAAKARRRLLRRRSDSAVEQISGGWQEFEDIILDHGYSPPISGTRTEIAAVLQSPTAHTLAVDADRAIFSGSELTPDEPEAFWNTVGDIETQLNTGLSRWSRFKTAISLRSLGGYSVTSLFKR